MRRKLPAGDAGHRSAKRKANSPQPLSAKALIAQAERNAAAWQAKIHPEPRPLSRTERRRNREFYNLP